MTDDKAAIFLLLKRGDYLPRELSTTHCPLLCFGFILFNKSFRVAPLRPEEDANMRDVPSVYAGPLLIWLKLFRLQLNAKCYM